MPVKHFLSATILFMTPFISMANTQDTSAARACLNEYELNHFSTAFEKCMPLAQNKDPLAQYAVAMMYKRGVGVKQSQSDALHWFTQSAQGGYAASQLRVGKILSTGTLAQTDYQKAAEYFTKAALQNDKDAQFLLALCYENGIGVKQSSQEALTWYNKAIQNGLDAPLLNALSQKTISSKKHATKSDFVTLKLAAEQGDFDAQYQVALHYVNAQETTQDDAQALYWLQKAAEQQNTQAMTYLAWMAMLGLGIPQNTAQAVHYFVNAHQPEELKDTPISFAPSQTQVDAKARAIALYEQGIDLLERHEDSASIKLAINLLEQAAKSNNAQAQAKLAHCYQTGEWVIQNKEKAAKYYEKAARNGNSEAQYKLGWIYFNGDGVSKNVAQSYYWFNLASAYGGARAKSAKNFVLSQMDANQLATAEKLSGQIAKK